MRVASGSAGVLWLIVLLAAVLRVVPVWFGFPFPHARPDEAVAIGHAMDVLQGEFNPRFFHWPSFTFYLFAGVFAIASAVRRILLGDGVLTLVESSIIARTVVALAGTATVVVIYAIGRRMADGATGLLAGLFLAVAILHVRDSHFAMTDVLMTLLVTASLALLLRAVDGVFAAEPPDSEAPRPFAIAGFVGGLGTSTKYNGAAILAAMGAAQIWVWARSQSRPWVPQGWVPSLAFGATFLVGFFAASPYALLDFNKFSADLVFDFTHLSGGHGINLGRGWLYHFSTSLPFGTGVMIFAAGLGGIPVLIEQYPRQAFIIGTFALAFYAAIGSGYTVFFRYVLPLVPLVCLTAAVAVRWLGPRLAAATGLKQAPAYGLLILLTAGPALVNCVWFDVLLARTDTRVVAGRWLASRLQPGDTVHDAGGDYARLELGDTRFHYWHFDPNANSFGHPEGHTPDWLVLTQSPLRTYAQAHPLLRRLANERYALVFTARGTKGAAGAAVYDLQDAFFMPVTDFETVERPGPTVLIYRRKH